MCAARPRPCNRTLRRVGQRWAIVGVIACLPALAHAAAPEAEEEAGEEAAAPPAPKKPRRDPFGGGKEEGPPDGRAWALGVEGTVITTPPLRTRVVYVDPRYLGRSTALGGLGVFARYRPLSFIGFDANVRTGSLRLRAQDNDTTISTDQVLADVGALLYLGRGKVSQFAASGGLGGQFQRVRYELDSGTRGTQSFGAFTVRVGAEAEFLVGRIAILLSFRTYGVATPRSRARSSGALFENRSGEDTHAPVAAFQTYLAGSAGVAYRF